ncbi:unnamed protein product [Cladocopium goreaui]|uniref:Sulfotransferase domain-containing protein n=1 Tax=Cladocopium goreaui TaxID=2562237 RepID=A0A9P1DLI6_9DINO|nr:unnamed protein product [Cladocopium goreaui]
MAGWKVLVPATVAMVLLVCTVPGPQLWIDRRQVQLALRRSPPNETLDTNITNETGQEGVTVVAELPTTGTPTSPTMLATTSMIATTQITDGTTEGTEGTTVPRMSLPFVPSLRLGQTRKELKFIHITKTGGTAIEDWAKGRGLRWGRFHSEYGARGLPGSPWHHPFPKLPSSLRHRYDWFLVVRDPVERIVSEYYCPFTGTKTPKTDTEDVFNKFVQSSLDGSRWIHPGSFQAMSEACQQCPKLEGACIMHLEIDLAYIQNEIPPWVLIFACVLPLTPNVR